MARKLVWERRLTFKLEVPEDSDDPHQRARIEWNVAETNMGVLTRSNSIKVDDGPNVLNMLAGDLIEFLAEQVPEWEELIQKSFQSRVREHDDS
jgi:hypothetical protein